MNTMTEKYLAPKELTEALCEQGICYTVTYIRAIRRAAITNGEELFVGRNARASEVIAWLKKHPKFSRRA